ncbi:hypothetical protein GQX73_g6406 [Xylaria multiplex]|uniref:Amidoligase enzyme n=1 Tax=Xylaria multiplex TaxID=323545 RepID=A0A7C8IZ93_9PEZI|nr:hypothetical protein GQX73_g6406 [Xylaria multiplex]
MSSGDPGSSYPYPTKGVIYSEPPWVADFGDRANFQYKERERHDESFGGGPGLDRGLANLGATGISPAEANQPADSDLDQGTFGVELEFLVVQCPKDEYLDIYIGENGTYSDLNDLTKLTRVLRDRGLVVIKSPEGDINEEEYALSHVPINDFSESEASDDEREENFSNRSRLGNFHSQYQYNLFKDNNENISSALLTWQQDYNEYHRKNGLKIYRTRDQDIKDLANDRCTVSWWPGITQEQLQKFRVILEQRLRQYRNISKQQRENERNRQIDPLHVPVPGLRQQYKAWTVTVDGSVNGAGMTQERYANANGSKHPFDEYFWFGAEVVSPVLPMGDERSREAVEVACGALRDALRCHKPMEVSTGLHIHLGHTKGWTLLQAKRFATFWCLTENTILRLHRRDRDMDRKWCAKMKWGSRLWRALYSRSQSEREECASIPQRHLGDKKLGFEADMNANVPCGDLIWTSNVFIYYIWQFDSITALHEGLGENQYCRTAIKWRIRGQNSSLEGDPDEPNEPGTIETRVMQGTLDADHINHWVVILEHIVDAVRNMEDAEFRDLIRRLLLDKSQDGFLRLLGVPEDVREYWRNPKRRDTDDRFWEYPDKDKVDWADPFSMWLFGA